MISSALLSACYIFKAFWNATEKGAENAEDFRLRFRKLAADVPAAWEHSLSEAKAHGDAEKVMIEEAKLNAAREAAAEFERLAC